MGGHFGLSRFSGWFDVPAAIEICDHLAVGLASQPAFADPAGAKFVMFAELERRGQRSIR